jgi:hypothetical protein
VWYVDMAMLGNSLPEGWGTILSTIPTISTTILGLLPGRKLMSARLPRVTLISRRPPSGLPSSPLHCSTSSTAGSCSVILSEQPVGFLVARASLRLRRTKKEAAQWPALSRNRVDQVHIASSDIIRRTWCVAFRPARAVAAVQLPALTGTPPRV